MSANPDDIGEPGELGGETLTKAKLADILCTHIGLNGREARDFAGQFFEEISAALERGEEVKLYGFGHFKLRVKRPRPGRNPRTRETFQVSARRVVSFRPSDTLKSRIVPKSKAR